MPVKRRQNLAETDRGSHYKEQWKEEFLDRKIAFYNSNESDYDDESIMKIMNNSSHRKVLPVAAIK